MRCLSLSFPLRQLDPGPADLLVCSVGSDIYPWQGLAGLLDWCFAGKLSHLVKQHFFSGHGEESLLLPGYPYVPFEKVLLVGMGPTSPVKDTSQEVHTKALLHTLVGLRPAQALIEPPHQDSPLSLLQERLETMTTRLEEARLREPVWLIQDPHTLQQLQRPPRASYGPSVVIHDM